MQNRALGLYLCRRVIINGFCLVAVPVDAVLREAVQSSWLNVRYWERGCPKPDMLKRALNSNLVRMADISDKTRFVQWHNIWVAAVLIGDRRIALLKWNAAN